MTSTQETTALATQGSRGRPEIPVLAADLEQVLISGDLAKLTPIQRVEFYTAVCKSLGLNPLTKPFEYVTLNGKLQLYARKDCTDQLRKLYHISIRVTDRAEASGVYVVTVRVWTPSGREDEDCGAVSMPEGTKGETRANAVMKAHTKAKRRATLSICGLGVVDESELGTIPGAVPADLVEGIDVGGATMGTKQAAQNVAQRKINELRKPPAATHAAPRQEEPEQPPHACAPPDIVQELEQLHERMGRKISTVVVAFGELKKAVYDAFGSEVPYYEILAKHGMQHSNDVKKVGIERTRAAADDLFCLLKKWEQDQPELPPAEARLAPNDVISQEQVNDLLVAGYERGLERADMIAAIRLRGYEFPGDIRQKDYDAILADIKGGDAAE